MKILLDVVEIPVIKWEFAVAGEGAFFPTGSCGPRKVS
jgi:hypothetical protein